MRFPLREAEVLALARNMQAGLSDNPSVYPAPPITPANLAGRIDAYNQKKAALVAAQAAVQKPLVQ